MSAGKKHTHEARAGHGDQGIGELRCLWRTETVKSQSPGRLSQNRRCSRASGDGTGKGTPGRTREDEEKDSGSDNEGETSPPEAGLL